MFYTQAKALSDADGSTHADAFIHSHVPDIRLPLLVFLHTPTRALIRKRSMGGRGALRWESYLRTRSMKYTSRRMFSGQVLDWQTYIRCRGPAAGAAAEARETPHWEDRRWSEGWAAEQHVQGVKKSITVNQASAASQGGKEGKLYPGSGPPELACCVQRGGNPLDVTYILIFMNALIAPLKTLPWPGGGYLYKRVRQAKNEGKGYLLIPFAHRERNLAVILIATGNNYLAVNSGKRVTWTHPALITRCEGWTVVTDAWMFSESKMCVYWSVCER